MRTFIASIRIDPRFWLILVLLFGLASVKAAAQTEPEAPTEPVKLYNGYQFSFYGGGSLFYTSGEYNSVSKGDFVGDISSTNFMYGASLNIPVLEDLALYLRAGRNSASTDWATARTDSTSGSTGYILSDMVFDYDILHLDFLLRLIGSMDGERVYIGPSFGLVRKKHVLITDTDLTTGAKRVVEDGPLDVEHDLRLSMVIGAEYAFVPFKNLYVVPALEVDYAFSKILQERSTRPNFVFRPTYYKFLVTVSYQVF